MSRKSHPPVPSNAADLPAWFDHTKHLLTDSGVMERRTGVWLAADGLPLDGPRRAAALAPAPVEYPEPAPEPAAAPDEEMES